MKNLSLADQLNYRQYIEDSILESMDICKDKVYIFNPVKYFNYYEELHSSEKQILRFEINALKKSDLVIVNFNDVYSLGTMSEIAIAYDHQIPIIGYNKDNGNELHAWQTEMADVIFDNIELLIDYVKNYYLI